MALTDIITLGHDPLDDQRTRQLKSVTLLVVVGVMSITVTNLLFGVERSPFHMTMDLIVLALAVCLIVSLGATRSLELGWWIFVPAFMVIQVAATILTGSVEGDVATFFVIPLAAVVILGPERSQPWFWTSVLAILAIPLIDALLAGSAFPLNVTTNNPDGTISGDSILFREAIPIALAVGFGYFLTRSAYQLLGQAKDIIEVQRDELAAAHARSESLLANMLPGPIAERLKTNPDETIADDFDQVTIMFADIVGFTPLAATMSAHDTVNVLNRVFTEFDKLADKRGLEKIKTIGDAYMVAGGMPDRRADHAEAIGWLALEVLETTDRLRTELGVDLHIRVGINTGPAVAGVIGTRKLFYDVWGDTVNTAARMQSQGTTDQIRVTEASYQLIADTFEFHDDGVIEAKGRGPVHVYRLVRGLLPG